MASVYRSLSGRVPILASIFPIGCPNPTFTRKFIPKLLRYSTATLTIGDKVRHEKYIIETRKKQEDPSVADIARRSFPILQQKVGAFRMVYLDNAATSQTPYPVLQAQNDYYRNYNSGVHHGIHNLSVEAIDLYELARAKVAYFINAMKPREIVFTRNATEGINLVAYSWGLLNLRYGDEVLVTIAEHHSAIVPWQLIAKKTGATLKYVGLTKEEVPDIEQFKKLLSTKTTRSTKTKLVVTHHVSHTLGSVLPIDEIIIRSHDVGAKVLLDACQSVPHMVVDVQKLNVDFLVASSHKMCGPTGIGFLYCKSKILSEMDPFIGSSGKIADTFQDQSIFSQPSFRFETGTPAIAEAVGLAAAIDYLLDIGMQRIHDYEKELANYLYHSLLSIRHVRVYGPAPSESVHRAALCSFNVEGIHPTEIAKFLYEQHGVAICAGHHCAQPLHRSLGIAASARASVRFYTPESEVEYLCESLDTTIRFLSSYRYRSPFKCSDFYCDDIECSCFDDF